MNEQRWVSEVWAWGQRDRVGGTGRGQEAGKGPGLGAWLALTPERGAAASGWRPLGWHAQSMEPGPQAT